MYVIDCFWMNGKYLLNYTIEIIWFHTKIIISLQSELYLPIFCTISKKLLETNHSWGSSKWQNWSFFKSFLTYKRLGHQKFIYHSFTFSNSTFGNCTFLTADELYFEFGERIEIGDVDKCIVFDCFLFPASTIS